MRDQSLYFLDGNHEDFSRLYKFPVGADGLRWLRPNIAHVPRGYRATLLSGRTFAALGGANSVDVGNRLPGSSWWAEESITDDDLAALGNAGADLMVGHDAPLGVPALDRRLAATDHWWPEAGVAYSAAGRQMFHHGFLQVRPRLYLGGHYHYHVDETVDFDTGGEPFSCRVVILDMNQGHGWSQAILDVAALDLQYFARDDATVTKLSGSEVGRWRVWTQGSSHILDLDRMTVTRVPGEGRPPSINDTTRQLRTIDNCRVGEHGAWTMHTDTRPDTVDFYWHYTSKIRSIERMAGEEQAGAHR